jgi:hypothetical protein
MRRMFNPYDYWRAALSTGQMMAEAQSVIAMRTMGMAGLWNVSPGENARMVAEKGHAMRDAGFAATRAILLGKGPAAVAEAALKPIRRKTRSNAKRLARRGPVSGA